jgi:hypothetical protein
VSAALSDAVAEVLAQGLELLCSVDKDEYRRRVGAPYSASVGEHYRHVLEHFTCVLAGLAAREIDYDKRERDRLLETNLDYARNMTEFIVAGFRDLDPAFEATRCGVAYSVSYANAEAMRLESTFGREIAFAVGHAVHHFAIIRLLCSELRVDLSCAFGVAPSTLKHRQAQLAG